MKKTIPAILAAVLLAACDPAPDEPVDEPEPAPAEPALADEADLEALRQAWKQEADPALRRVRSAAEGFRDAVQGLLNEPGEERLETARTAWHQLYSHWNRALVVLAARNLEDDTERFLRVDPLPIFPGYVDGLAAWPESGLVHDPTIALDSETLLAQQELTARGEITTGFQVIHFLLFGEPEHERTAAQLSEAGEDEDNALARQRRREYLTLITDMLARDLTVLARQEEDANTSASALLDGLAFAMERHEELHALDGATNPVEGLYLAADARETALAPLREAVDYWLTGDGREPLLAVLEQTDEEAAAVVTEHGEDWTEEDTPSLSAPSY